MLKWLTPTKQDVQMATFFLSAPFKLLAMLLNALDKAQEDKSRQQRREILNYGTLSTIEAREIMNQKRLEAIKTERLRQEKLSKDIELTEQRTAYYRNANANFDPHAMRNHDAVEWNTCPNGHHQTKSLGDTCRECGSKMNLIQPYVK